MYRVTDRADFLRADSQVSWLYDNGAIVRGEEGEGARCEAVLSGMYMTGELEPCFLVVCMAG